MILDGEDRQFPVRQAFNRVVIQIQMRHLGCPHQRVGVEGEAVVLGGYLHFARCEIHHRLIPSMMAELELIALSPQLQAHDLMAKTNSKDWRWGERAITSSSA